jgi:putative phosphoribosyl transferase
LVEFEHLQARRHAAARELLHHSSCAIEVEIMADRTVTLPFANRAEAGRLLGRRLQAEHLQGPLVVVALPRGGVPVAAEVARCLGAPLDLLIVRKIGAPGQPELAVAALVDGTPPVIVVDEDISAATGADAAYIEREAAVERRELERRRETYLRSHAPLALVDTTAILVDDGIATGTTVRAALKGLRRRGAAKVLLAIPVAPRDTLMALRGSCDRIVCLAEPEPFHAVGAHYVDFHQVGDAEVLAAFGAGDGQDDR